MVKIKEIKARQVFDSRANPTIETEIETNKGKFSAMVPSGASTGKHEAIELRDNAKEFFGKGVLKAVRNVNTIIAKKIVNNNYANQEELDNELIKLDGTKNKSKLGANAVLSTSMAFARAIAKENNLDLHEYFAKKYKAKQLLPIPQMNIINSGKHAGKENDVQEHMIIPAKFNSYSEALRAGIEVYYTLKKSLKQKFGEQGTLLGDEGGFAPKIESLEERLELLLACIREAGYEKKVLIGLDCASSEFYKNEKYTIGKKEYSATELIDYYKELCEKYNIVSIEDGFAEDDFEAWKEFNNKLGKKIQIVGDDILVTNVERIQKAVQEKLCNALLLKINQIGTITEAIEAGETARKNEWKVIVSHRSGETEDNFIADLVVGLGYGQSKFGAPARSERTAKYNRLLKIEENLGTKAIFPKNIL
ncbi:MAG: phosphopyruvate hydratase [Candidatus Diapherotrites archaeon]